MLKISRKLILLLISLSILLTGCDKIPKTPDNFDEDLWKDSVKAIKILYDTIERGDNFSVDDEKVILNHYETYAHRSYDNFDETLMSLRVYQLYEKYNIFIVSDKRKPEQPMRENEKDFIKARNNLQELYDKLINKDTE